MPDRCWSFPRGQQGKGLDWFRRHAAAYEVEIRDLSQESMLIALQGPLSEQILDPLADAGLDKLRFQGFVETRIGDIDARVFRTGYTGEDGFEIWYPVEHPAALWDLLLESGESRGLNRADSGKRYPAPWRPDLRSTARDRRIDQSDGSRPGMEVKLKKADFIGRDALLEVRREGVARKLVGLSCWNGDSPAG